METEEKKCWCCHCGDWHDDKQYAQRFGRCRSCHNHFMAWRYRQSRTSPFAPTDVATYRKEHGIEKKPRPRPEVLTECSACMKRNREHGSFCRGCGNAYTQWAAKRRKHAAANGRVADCSIEEFQLAVDQEWVVPRHPGEPHVGRVVRHV